MVKRKYLPPDMNLFIKDCQNQPIKNIYIDTTVFDTRMHNIAVYDFFSAGNYFGVTLYISTPENKFPKKGEILIVREKSIEEEIVDAEKNQIWFIKVIYIKPYTTYSYREIPTKNGEIYGIILCTFDLSLFNRFYKNYFIKKES